MFGSLPIKVNFFATSNALMEYGRDFYQFFNTSSRALLNGGLGVGRGSIIPSIIGRTIHHYIPMRVDFLCSFSGREASGHFFSAHAQAYCLGYGNGPLCSGSNGFIGCVFVFRSVARAIGDRRMLHRDHQGARLTVGTTGVVF